MYEDIFDAKNACEHLSGFNVCNRYLVVLYYQPHKVRLHILMCVSLCMCVGGGGGGGQVGAWVDACVCVWAGGCVGGCLRVCVRVCWVDDEAKSNSKSRV